MKSHQFEDKLMELETLAKAGGLSTEEIVSSYEIRKMAIEDEYEGEDEDEDE